MLAPDLLRFHCGQRIHEDRLQGRQHSFQNIVQAHVTAELLQLRPIESGRFASCIDPNEEVFPVLAFRGLDVCGQSLFLQVERGTDCLTTAAS
jgi:hypothetical protein